MLVKQIAILLITLLPMPVYAQQVSFLTFLSEFEKKERIDSTSFVKEFDFIDHEEMYSRFLPQANGGCHCESEDARWQRGGYIECENFTLVMLQRYCSDYQDGNSRWFMENDGKDYMLITYSHGGEVIDYKTIGHSGTAAYAVRMTTSRSGLGVVVEQRILDDCKLLRQYKDLVYTVHKHEYTFNPDGMIEERSIESPHKEIVDVMSSVEQFSFGRFLSYFQKRDKPRMDDTLFDIPKDSPELPFESCLSLIPDKLDCNSWPRDIRWIPCQYFERKGVFYISIIKECMTPKAGFMPYTDYMILEFRKNGAFRRARSIYHWDEDAVQDSTMMRFLITNGLESFCAEENVK